MATLSIKSVSSTARRSRTAEVAAIAIVVLVAFAIRLFNLDGRSPHYDEVLPLLFGQAPLERMVYGTAADTMPPMYYALLHFWTLPGNGLFYARFLSLAFGALCIPFLYNIGRRTLGRGSALLACVILALSPFHIFYSQEIRMYSLLALLGLAATYFFVRWWQEGALIWWVCLTLTLALSMYVHNLAFLLLLSLDLVTLGLVLAKVQRAKRAVVELGATHILVAAAYVPWLFYLPQQVAKIQQAFWIERPGLSEIVRTAMVFHFNLPTPTWMLPAVLFVSLLMIALTVYRTSRMLRTRAKEDRARLLVIGGMWLVPPALMLTVSQVRPIYVERGVMLSSLMYYLLLAHAFVTLPRGWLRWLLVALYTPLVIFSIGYHYSYNDFPRSPFRELAAYLSSEIMPGDYVLHDNKLSFFSTRYYSPGLPHGFVADPPGSRNDNLAPAMMEVFEAFPMASEEAARSHERVWYVVFQRALDEARAAGVEHAQKASFDRQYQLVREHTIGDLRLYLYDTGSKD